MSTSSIHLSQSASDKIKELIEEEEEELFLRVYVSGGGCSGFQYGFAFETQSQEDDFIIEKGSTQSNPISLLIDSLSMQYLKGSKIDYSEDEKGAQFIIQNPNAKTTCGCGSSFSPKEN